MSLIHSLCELRLSADYKCVVLVRTREGVGQTHQTEHLDPALVELGLQLRERAELRRAHGREVARVGEENGL